MQQSSPRPSIRAPYLCTVEAEFRERNVPGLNLHLTTRFADDVLALGPIRIRIAVSRAYLNFRLQNCGLPLSCSLEQTWPRREKTKSTIKKRSAKQEVGGDQIALTASATPSVKISEKLHAQVSSVVDIKTEGTTTWQHVFWRGSTDQPSLVFDSRPNHQFLNGTLLSGELIGSLEPKHVGYYDVSIELEIPKSGLLIESGDEFISYPNKKGLIKILAALALCRSPVRIYESGFHE